MLWHQNFGKYFIVSFALLVSLLGHILPPHFAKSVLVVVNFFTAMIPILVVGALIKYICCGSYCCDTKNKK